MNIAIILAGGTGTRVNAGMPKQFVEILGKPILIYTIEKFENHPCIDAIEIVCVENYIEHLKKLVEQYNLSKVRWIVKGGDNFQHSVLNGVLNLHNKISLKDIVLIHYAASPFVSDDIINDGINVAKEKGNCTSATPCFLLTGSNDDGKQSTQFIDRDKIMQLNSPQCFRYEYVFQLYQEALSKNLLDQVEPHTTSLMYLLGHTIYFSKGNQTNIKITTKEDLDLFEGYVLMKRRKQKKAKVTNHTENSLL